MIHISFLPKKIFYHFMWQEKIRVRCILTEYDRTQKNGKGNVDLLTSHNDILLWSLLVNCPRKWFFLLYTLHIFISAAQLIVPSSRVSKSDPKDVVIKFKGPVDMRKHGWHQTLGHNAGPMNSARIQGKTSYQGGPSLVYIKIYNIILMKKRGNKKKKGLIS